MLSCTMWFQSSVVLGLTDVWSAIRNATVSRLSHVIEHFSLSDLEMFFNELCDVRKSHKISHLSYRSFADPQLAVAHLQLRRRGMERPAGSRHSCAVTRRLLTAS